MIGLKADGSPYRIMIVDDSIFVQNQIKKLLLPEGFEIVATAGHGREAIEKYQSLCSSIDLVTMDITMPGMHGVEAMKEIIKINPDACVVIVSALGRTDLMKEALLCGAANYIIKPIKRKNLLQTIQYAIQAFI